MARVPWIVATTFLLAGCAADNTDAIKQAIKKNLPIAYEVEYGKFQKFPRGVVCGEFTPIGRFGVPENTRPFVYVAGKVEFVPSQDDLAIFCTKDQDEQVEKIMGISLPAKENSPLLAIYRDLTALDDSLQLYLSDNQIYPVTAQGLEALASKSDAYPKPRKFRAGGYLSEVPPDPWGRPYHYESEEKLRMEPIEYSLYTLGRDGKKGGTGDDADISSLQLKYLKHVLEK